MINYSDKLISVLKSNESIKTVWFVGEDWYFNAQEGAKEVSRAEVLGEKPAPASKTTKTTKK